MLCDAINDDDMDMDMDTDEEFINLKSSGDSSQDLDDISDQQCMKNLHSQIKERIDKGIYTVYQASNVKSIVWKILRKIRNEDNIYVEGYVWCTQCSNVLYDYPMSRNKHECCQKLKDMLQIEYENNFTLQKYGNNKELIKIAENIENGLYTLTTYSGRSIVWKILRRIVDENKRLVDGYAWCTKCNTVLMDYPSNRTRHKCSIVLKRATVKEYLQNKRKAERLAIANQIENGNYTLTYWYTTKKYVQRIMQRILKADKTLVEGYVFCNQCRRVMSEYGSQQDKHQCYRDLINDIFGDDESHAFRNNTSNLRRFDIAEKLDKGIYTLTKQQGTSYLWKIMRKILKEDKTPVEDYMCCIRCGTICSSHSATNLNKHKCSKELRKSMREDNEDKAKDPLNKPSRSLSDEEFQTKPEFCSQIAQKIQLGIYTLIERKSRGYIWKIIRNIQRADDKTLLKGYVCCIECRNVYCTQFTENLYVHRCCKILKETLLKKDSEEKDSRVTAAVECPKGESLKNSKANDVNNDDIAKKIAQGLYTVTSMKRRCYVSQLMKLILKEDKTIYKDYVFCIKCRKVYSSLNTSNLYQHKCYREFKRSIFKKRAEKDDDDDEDENISRQDFACDEDWIIKDQDFSTSIGVIIDKSFTTSNLEEDEDLLWDNIQIEDTEFGSTMATEQFIQFESDEKSSNQDFINKTRYKQNSFRSEKIPKCLATNAKISEERRSMRNILRKDKNLMDYGSSNDEESKDKDDDCQLLEKTKNRKEARPSTSREAAKICDFTKETKNRKESRPSTSREAAKICDFTKETKTCQESRLSATKDAANNCDFLEGTKTCQESRPSATKDAANNCDFMEGTKNRKDPSLAKSKDAAKICDFTEETKNHKESRASTSRDAAKICDFTEETKKCRESRPFASKDSAKNFEFFEETKKLITTNSDRLNSKSLQEKSNPKRKIPQDEDELETVESHETNMNNMKAEMMKPTSFSKKFKHGQSFNSDKKISSSIDSIDPKKVLHSQASISSLDPQLNSRETIQILNEVYTISQKRKNKSPIWNVLAEILRKDNSILAGYVYCRKCKTVLKYKPSQMSILYRHICCREEESKNSKNAIGKSYKDSSMNDESLKSLDDIGIITINKSTDEGNKDEYLLQSDDDDLFENRYEDTEIVDLNTDEHEENEDEDDEDLWQSDHDIGNKTLSSNLSVNNEYKNTDVDDADGDEETKDDDYCSRIAQKIQEGIYGLVQRKKSKNPIWKVLGEIKNEYGNILANCLYCLECHRVLRYEDKTKVMLYGHKCVKAQSNRDDFVKPYSNTCSSISQLIEKGIYSICARTKDQSYLWTVMGKIQQKDGTYIKGFLSCRKCQNVIKYTSNRTENVYRHKCLLEYKRLLGIHGNQKSFHSEFFPSSLQTKDHTKMETPELPSDTFKSIKRNEALTVSRCIDQGIYKLAQNHKDPAYIWQILAHIEKPNGNYLRNCVYCRQCHRVLEIEENDLSKLYLHACIIELKRIKHSDYMEDCLEACVQWSIEQCLPLWASKEEPFSNLMEYFLKLGSIHSTTDPAKMQNIKLPNHGEILQNFQTMKEKTKETLHRNLMKMLIDKGNISASIAMWSDDYLKRNYFITTLHYYSNEEVNSLVMGMKSMRFENSSPEYFLRKLKSLFQDFGITDIANIKFISTGDNRIINEALKNYTHLPSNSHLLTNILDEVFENDMEFMALLNKCHNLRKANENSTSDLDTKTISHTSLPLWSKAYETFRTISSNPKSNHYNDLDLDQLKNLTEMLWGFKIIFKRLQDTSSPSLCFVIPSIRKISKLCEPNCIDKPLIAKLKNQILKETHEKWSSKLNLWHKAAFFLYPLALEIQNPNDFNELKKFCISQMRDLYENTIPSNNQDLAKSSPTLREKDAMEFFFTDLLKPNSQGPISDAIYSQELEKYMKSLVLINTQFNVLQWWLQNAINYPNLSKLAFQILSIPASTAMAEETASLAANLMAEKRKNSLNPKLSDNIIFLHSYHKNCVK
ncbi:uncharacterized protein LOC142222318 isoform X2 [Haematobia irritans]|uniref:uncharacterized protein LOC142222318 isoform X2 n=1 Tax=Haematobia irritans TaxID=7368 RepID=UPI003F4F4431